ncbi:movement protein [Cowpea mottle virus]|uniref:Movement protein n=1 Tax=Cowpea mottle virus TaxID=12627 RepID=Q89595_9TOMB|nr:movement protein [Cowpea mottle virus]AAC54605.1 movement protein [Cowpea mottle virus]prf//2123377D movement protein [Cowpea mottle virus]
MINHFAAITGVILLLWLIRSHSILTSIYEQNTPRVITYANLLLLLIAYCYFCSTQSVSYVVSHSEPVVNSKVVYISVGTSPPSLQVSE